ncbi:MAG: hypothetical protein O7D30_11945, partial [Rickettsia endosymbiont of Ixodes persulcatus]|nr:hypothetical protein [Rickettsia endosymbiont of Ixodes persulcatus]
PELNYPSQIISNSKCETTPAYTRLTHNYKVFPKAGAEMATEKNNSRKNTVDAQNLHNLLENDLFSSVINCDF